METGFAIAQNGIHNAVTAQSVIANNLSNLNTPAFKARRTQSGTFRIPGSQVVDVLPNPVQGSFKQTTRELDLAIAGEGYFILQTDTGPAYTRAGTLHRDQEGNLVTPGGYLLEADIEYPEEGVGLTVTEDGRAFARYQNGETEEVGELELAKFRNPAGLIPAGDNIFKAGPNSGQPRVVAPGEEGAGLISQGFVERSNVDEATEITNQLINQRHFQASVKTFKVMDKLLANAIDIVR